MISTLVIDGKDLAYVLRDALPSLTDALALTYGGPLLYVAQQYGITTPLRLAHFLAQVAHESGEFKYTEELASGQAYEGRKSLGNTQPGDGVRFKGRGLIQITGRYNYKRYANFMKNSRLLEEPGLLKELPWSADSAGWFWRFGNGTDASNAADKDNLLAVTRIINGGTRGLADRQRKLKQFKRALDVRSTMKVQQALNAMGSYPQLLVDGEFGPRTTSIVRELQADHFMEPTGVVDAALWAKLKKYAETDHG